MHEQHLLQLLSRIIEWVDPPDTVSQAIEDGKSERYWLHNHHWDPYTREMQACARIHTDSPHHIIITINYQY